MGVVRFIGVTEHAVRKCGMRRGRDDTGADQSGPGFAAQRFDSATHPLYEIKSDRLLALMTVYSGVIPAAAAILRYFAMSAFCSALSASGVEPTTSVATSSWRFL